MTSTAQPMRARIGNGTPIHCVAFNVRAGAEYVCIACVTREPGPPRRLGDPYLNFAVSKVVPMIQAPGTARRTAHLPTTGLPASIPS